MLGLACALAVALCVSGKSGAAGCTLWEARFKKTLLDHRRTAVVQSARHRAVHADDVIGQFANSPPRYMRALLAHTRARTHVRMHECTHAFFTRRRSARALAAWCFRQRAQSPLAGKPVSEQKPPRHLTQASCSALRLRLGLLCARAAGRRLRVDLPEWKVPRHDDEHDAQRVERHIRPCGRNQSCTILEMRPRAYWM